MIGLWVEKDGVVELGKVLEGHESTKSLSNKKLALYLAD